MIQYNILDGIKQNINLGEILLEDDAVKMLPIGEVWEEYCRREGVCDDLHFYDEIEKYEREVLVKRA